MFLNLILFIVFWINDATPKSEVEKYEHFVNKTHMYQFDEHFHLHKMHSTRHAKLFLLGCRDLYYKNSSSNNSPTFTVENTDDLIILGIFSLDIVSILLYFEEPTNNSSYVNITLGIDRNNNATIGMGREIEHFVMEEDLMPIMPFYVAINGSNKSVKISELRTRASKPFLEINTNSTLGPPHFRIDHEGPVYAHYSCCEETCKRQVYQRISGCNKFTIYNQASKEMIFDLKYFINNDMKDDKIVFSENFFIDYPNNARFGVSIKFLEYDDRLSNYYHIVLTNYYSSIFQYSTKSNDRNFTTDTFKRNLPNPISFNITVMESGRVTLSGTGSSDSMLSLTYKPQVYHRNPFNISYISVAKLYDDSIRYDLYMNCTDFLTYYNNTPTTPVTQIFEKFVYRFNDIRYDLIQIFNDTFSLNENYQKYTKEESDQYDIDLESVDSNQSSKKINETKEDSTMNFLQKSATALCSFIFIGILKFILSLNCIKAIINFQNTEKVDEKIKQISGSIAENVNETIMKLADHSTDDIEIE